MKRYCIILLIIFSFSVHAQETYTLRFLPQLQQSQWINASNYGTNRLSIGLPGISSIYLSAYNSGFTYHTLFTKGDSNKTIIHPGDFINQLKSKNYIGLNTSVSLLSVNYQVKDKDLSIGFSINEHITTQFGYPKELLSVLWSGNGSFIGKSAELGNFSLETSWYRSYAAHGVKKYKKWTFGLSPALLFGKANIHTQKSTFKLYTDTGIYALTADAELNLQTSGIPDSNDNNAGFLNTGSKVKDYMLNTKNKGMSIDLGATYQYNEKIDITAGVHNLGYINWQSNIHNHTAGPSSFYFDGLDFSSFFQGDVDFISPKKWTDSMKKIINFNKNSNNYSTVLPYELFAIGNYDLNHHKIGLQLNAQRFNKSFLYAATVCYQLKLGKHFTGAASYTLKTQSPFNLGAAVIVQFLHTQWYFVSDNLYAVFKPLDSKNFNMHMGINLVFDKKRKTSETAPGMPTADKPQ